MRQFAGTAYGSWPRTFREEKAEIGIQESEPKKTMQPLFKQLAGGVAAPPFPGQQIIFARAAPISVEQPMEAI